MLVWFLFGFMCALAVLLAAAYFKFVALRKAALRARLRLEAQLKQRRELLPSLALSAAAVEGLDRSFAYALSEMKEKCAACDTLAKRIACEAEVSEKLKQLFDAANARPELNQDEHFLHLRGSLAAAEDKIQNAKKRYNSAARDFNTLASVVPLNLVADTLDFDKFDYFDFYSSFPRPVSQ